MREKQRENRGCAARSGFTLIEMLIVITIIVILAGLTVAVVNTTINSDRIRGGARQMQSALLGSMTRALRAQKPVGLRFLRDENDPTTVSTMIYVEQLDPWTDGKVTVQRIDVNPADDTADADRALWITSTDLAATQWTRLIQQGLLPKITRIKLAGTWFNVSTDFVVDPCNAGVERLLVTSLIGGVDLLGSAENNIGEPFPPGDVEFALKTVPAVPVEFDYELELGVAPLANEEPLRLPNGAVIDLDYSLLPPEWTQTGIVLVDPAAVDPPPIPAGWFKVSDGNLVPNPNCGTPTDLREINIQRHIDILFTPQGVVSDSISGTGKVHFVLSEIADTLLNLAPEDPAATGEHRIMTIFTQTGNVSTHEVSLSGNRFEFAETGEVAGR